MVFVDTAGLREAENEIEEEGIRRTRRVAVQAELLLHVLDRSEPLSETDREYLREFSGTPRLLVANKADLEPRLELPAEEAGKAVSVSCRTGDGLEGLKDAIVREVEAGRTEAGTQEVTINARHEDILRRTRGAVVGAKDILREQGALELAAFELRLGVQAIGEMLKKTTTEY